MNDKTYDTMLDNAIANFSIKSLDGMVGMVGTPKLPLASLIPSFVTPFKPFIGSDDKPFTSKMWGDDLFISGMDISSNNDFTSLLYGILRHPRDMEVLRIDSTGLLNTPRNILRDHIADKKLELLYINTKERRKIYSSRASLVLGYKNTLPMLMTKKEYDYAMFNDVFISVLKSSKNISPGKTLVNWN